MPLPGYKPILALEYKNGDDLSKKKKHFRAFWDKQLVIASKILNIL